MAHGYLGDGYGAHGDFGDDRDEDRDRDRRERGWRDRDEQERNQRSDRGMMFGDHDRDRGRSDEDRWNRDSYARGQGGFGGSGDYSRGRQSFSAHPDDHYRSWRDRHMSELDRDYGDYCREREQSFHREFDDWRQRKYGNPQPLRTGMTQSGLSHDPSGVTEAVQDSAPATSADSDPTATATLGTNSGGGGRSRR